MAEIGNRMAYRLEQSINGERFRTVARFVLQQDGAMALDAFAKSYPDDDFRLYASNGSLLAESPR